MKIAKYVVIAQMVLSAILVVIFVTRSMASNRAKADDHAAAATRPDEGHGAAKTDKADKTDKSGKGESPAHKADPHDKGGAAEPAHEAAGEEDGASKRTPQGQAAHEGAEIAEFKLDVVSEAPPESKADKDDNHGRADKGHGRARGKDGDHKRPQDEASPAPAASAAFGTNPKVVAQNLLAGNARFIDGQRNGLDLVAQRVTSAGGQHPGVMVLGCADSRVPPELIFDRGVGEMFVVRSAGNIAEPVAVGSLEYAAEHLHTKVLLVLGHEKCGAVQAALSDAKLPSANLEAMVDAISPAVKELKAWVSGNQLIRMAVEANVRRQADEVLRRSSLLRAAVARKDLTVLKAVYDIQSGRVRPL